MTSFDRPPLEPAEQLQLLEARGLQISDRDRALRLLEVTSLFRLTPYMRPFQFREDAERRFRPGARLADVVSVYSLDAELRHAVMVAIERIEVALRACISNSMAPRHGAHWYIWGEGEFLGAPQASSSSMMRSTARLELSHS